MITTMNISLADYLKQKEGTIWHWIKYRVYNTWSEVIEKKQDNRPSKRKKTVSRICTWSRDQTTVLADYLKAERSANWHWIRYGVYITCSEVIEKKNRITDPVRGKNTNYLLHKLTLHNIASSFSNGRGHRSRSRQSQTARTRWDRHERNNIYI